MEQILNLSGGSTIESELYSLFPGQQYFVSVNLVVVHIVFQSSGDRLRGPVPISVYIWGMQPGLSNNCIARI